MLSDFDWVRTGKGQCQALHLQTLERSVCNLCLLIPAAPGPPTVRQRTATTAHRSPLPARRSRRRTFRELEMRFRNFVPLILFVLFTLPGGAAFLFAWVGFPLVMSMVQFVHALLMFLVYRASLRCAAKNPDKPIQVPPQAYLPLKVNLALYIAIGQPLVWICSDSQAVLTVAHLLQLTGFSFVCYSGMLFVTRSRA